MPNTKQRSFTAIKDMRASQYRCKVGTVHDWLQHFAGHARLLLVYAQRSAYPLRGGAVAWVQDRIGSDPPESDGSLAAHLLRLRDPNTGQKISDDRLLPHVGCISPLFWFLLPLCKGFGRGHLHDFQPSLGSSKLCSICCNQPNCKKRCVPALCPGKSPENVLFASFLSQLGSTDPMQPLVSPALAALTPRQGASKSLQKR